MGSFARRARAPLLGGIAIWLLSFPLTTTHAARAITPTLASAIASGPSTDDRPSPTHHAARSLLIGEEVAAAPAPATAPAAPQPAAPVRPVAAAPRVGANWLLIPRLGLSQPVGWYSDCLGRAPVPRWGTWREGCAGSGNTYIMAHNPGVFSPILAMRPGDIVLYGDPNGIVHTYRITFTTIVSNTQLWPLGALAAPSLTLQTCWTWDGSRDFIVRGIQV
ncbi:MAG TPA: sortase [Candidatus Limnocylindrales bacterium]|nr:sortase [Candidatus Limnocylindrales bacterium]